MKRSILTIAVLFVVFLAFGQDQDKDFERKNYYELLGRANFFEVNNRYEILKDTIYYSSSGFLINAEWDEVSIDDKIYIIITYPNYSNGKQSSNDRKPLEGLVEENPVRQYIVNINGKILCIPKEEFEKIEKKPVYSVDFRRMRNYQITAGQLTLPFKLRPKEGDTNFQMTTDVTVGAYGGVRKRISKYSSTYLTIPVVLGLTFINVNENTTTNTGQVDFKSGITPGWTWATGIVIQTDRLSLGFVFGRDFASGYAEDWVYNNKTWYSFGIGYSFLK
ncbi:MAG: hypothetical protein KGZ90_11495 [Algoriphagus sp.]|nr:hypothetical protein [Algoriphagus sp.]